MSELAALSVRSVNERGSVALESARPVNEFVPAPKKIETETTTDTETEADTATEAAAETRKGKMDGPPTKDWTIRMSINGCGPAPMHRVHLADSRRPHRKLVT